MLSRTGFLALLSALSTSGAVAQTFPARPITVIEACTAERRAHDSGRPWVALCMVASIDGTTALDGASAGLSSDIDREMLLTLRTLADVIIVGAGTVRAEDYGVPKKPGQRIGVVSHSGKVDPSSRLFTSGAGFLILPEDAPQTAIESVRAGVGELDLGAALMQLPGSPTFVQAEGGPTINGALAANGLIDELNLTTSPQFVGGDGKRITADMPAMGQPYDLVQLCEDDGFLFCRYVRRRNG